MMARSFWPATFAAALCIGSSQASETIEVTVRYTIVPVCRFFAAASPTLALSNTGTPNEIDPRLGTPATGNLRIGYRCTSGTAPSFAVPASATLACASCIGAGALDAALTWTSDGAGTGMTSGGDRIFSLSAHVPPSSFQAAAPGDYVGNITVTVAP